MTSDHQQNLQIFVEGLNVLRVNNTECDVIFQIGPKSFMAHRIVLIVRMDYFQKMFSADMREKRELVIPFDQKIIDPEVFEEILQYIYTWKIDISLKNVGTIFKAADYFCFDELLSKTTGFLKENINFANVAQIIEIAIANGIETIENDCRQFIIENSLLDIGKQQLIPSFSYEDLGVSLQEMRNLSKYEDVYHYCVEWVLQDQTNRCEEMPNLLKSVPINSLSIQFLKKVVSTNNLVLNNKECLKLLVDVLVEKPQTEILYGIGGDDRGGLSSVSRLDSFTNQWILSPSMPSPLLCFGCTAIDNKVFICGGLDQSYMFKNELREFDIITNAWKTLKPMKRPRSYCSMAALNGYLYVAGGRNNGKRYSVVERYSIQNDEWEDVRPMNEIRSGLGLVEMNGFLYAIGGYDGFERCNSVERYDPQKNEWQRKANLNNTYGYLCASAILNDRIYFTGENKCEVYNPEEDKWSEMPAPNMCGEGLQLAAFNGKLLAFGGYENGKALKCVECFDFKDRIWIATKDMNVARAHARVAVVKV